MQTDAAYAAQVSQLMGTLATAYAKSQASSASSGGGSSAGNSAASALGKAAGSVGGAVAGQGSLNTPVPTGAAGAGLYSQGATTGDNSLASEAQPDLNVPDPAPLNYEDEAVDTSNLSGLFGGSDSSDLSSLFGSDF
jgi:hypothetical protein